MSAAVIIVNYESDGLLLNCLDALSHQSLTPQAVIVVDNHEEREAVTEFKKLFPHITFVTAGKNIGFAAAVNLGASRVSDVDFLALLNPDASPEVNWLRALVDAAEKNPDCGSFSSLMLNADDSETLDGCGDLMHFTGVPWRVGHGQPRKNFDNAKAGRFSACAGAALYRNKAWRRVGGFDESYFMYIEDVDLGFRLRLLGYPCCFVPEAVVHHIGSATAGYRSDFSVYYGHRNLVWNYFKNMPWQLILITLPFHVVMNLLTVIIFVLRGRSKVILKSKWDAILGLPQVLRRRTSSRREVSLLSIWQGLDKTLLLGKR